MKIFLENKFIIIIFLLITFLSACAHYVTFNTPPVYQYSQRNPIKAVFYMSDNLKGKIYSARAWSSGIANRWDVPIGKVVYEYANSYLKNAFARFKVSNIPEVTGNDILIKITDIDYYLKGQAAHCDITFSVLNTEGNVVFDKKYHKDGPSGYGRVLWGGALAQKSAIRQTTHVVLEDIFKDFVSDLKTHYFLQEGP